jgi:hypothetical protein
MSRETTLRAAAAFHRRASQVFTLRGLRPTRAGIARVIETERSNYSAVLDGRRGTLDAVVRWITAWNKKGWPPLVLIDDGVTVRVHLREHLRRVVDADERPVLLVLDDVLEPAPLDREARLEPIGPMAHLHNVRLELIERPGMLMRTLNDAALSGRCVLSDYWLRDDGLELRAEFARPRAEPFTPTDRDTVDALIQLRLRGCLPRE